MDSTIAQFPDTTLQEESIGQKMHGPTHPNDNSNFHVADSLSGNKFVSTDFD